MSRPYRLHPSPLTALRCRNHLTMAEAAMRLGVSTLEVARTGRDTRRIPACVRRAMVAALEPKSASAQLSIFDYLRSLDAQDGAHE